MASRYGILRVYSWTLALISGVWLAYGWVAVTDFPPLWGAALCVAACLFVFQFGVRAPRVGLITMERIPQIGLLLVVTPTVAATICAFASLLWPLINRRYSQGSITVAMLRGVHNAAMTALMLLVAGHVYLALGGQHPLTELTLANIGPLLAAAAIAQLINITLMALFFKFDGREVRQIITPSYAMSDLIFVPAGVLAAVLFNTGTAATFALFIGLMILFVLSFNGLGHGLGQGMNSNKNELGPLARIFQTRRALHGARSIDTLGERVVVESRSLFRFDEFYLGLVNRERQLLELPVHERRGVRMPARSKPLSAGMFGWVIEHAESVLVKNWTQATEALRERTEVTDKETGSIIVVPLLVQGDVIGLLSVQHTNAGVYSEADLHLMQRLAEEVAVAVSDARAFEDAENYRQHLEQRVAERTDELEIANREKEQLIAALRERSQVLERESQEDPLTGIANRRCFMQRLTAEFEVAKVVGHPLTLAIADLDLFKAVNDRLGHRVGDAALQQSAALIKALCQSTDMVGRIGGEEFALLLPGTTCDAAIKVCESIRNAVEKHDWRRVHPELQLTISIGLWQWDGKATVSELLHAADTQLYEAKRGGRNRVA